MPNMSRALFIVVEPVMYMDGYYCGEQYDSP